MSSLDEENLLQMVHDFIESSDSTITSSSPSLLSHNFYNPSTTQNHGHFLHSTRYLTLQEILSDKTGEEKEIFDRVGKYMRKKMDLEKTTRLKQWLVKCLKLEGLRASLCHTSWVTTPSCPCGNYEYIEILKEEHAKGGSLRVIVDIDFKSQFELARPTQSYVELSSKLPIIFVGSEDKLNKIISLLCSAAEQSLRERGLHIPPWRRANYMLSKWKPSNPTHCYNKSSSNSSNNNNNNNNNTNNNNNNNNFCDNNINANYPSRLEKWVPPKMMMKERRREMENKGSGLSNQFSNLGINCC